MARDIRSTLKTTIPSHLSTNVTNSAVKARMGLHGKGGASSPATWMSSPPSVAYPSFFGIEPGATIFRVTERGPEWITHLGRWVGNSFVVNDPMIGRQTYEIIVPWNGRADHRVQYRVTADTASAGPDGLVFIDTTQYR